MTPERPVQEEMCNPVFHIIGISDDPGQVLPSGASEVVSRATVFSGGHRHYELMHSRLPSGAVWIEITVPLSAVFARYQTYPEIVVFVSGDPLFYGFAATVKREVPQAEIVIYPYFNSLQMLAHRMLLPYQDLHAVSLTGRPWNAFDAALICGDPLIGVLTDRNKTPQAIASRMLEYGYSGYRITVGECIGHPELERVTTMTVEETAAKTFALPNCMILQRTTSVARPFGIPENRFQLLNGRTNMITKMPVRLLALSLLDLHNHRSLWDIGFCTGSVSIEAKMQFPQVEVTAFERRPECMPLMEANCQKFGVPGITAVSGDFLHLTLTDYPKPDAVFIGGHGGALEQMIQRIDNVLLPGGVIVFNSVTAASAVQFRESIAAVKRRVTDSVRIAVDDHNPIVIMKAE